MFIYILALLCVLAIALGQILFKLSALELNQSNLYNYKAIVYFLMAVVLYGFTSVGWVFVLKKIELARIYPLMAVAFIFVPLGSFYILGERFQPQYYLGVIFIIIGIFIAVRS